MTKKPSLFYFKKIKPRHDKNSGNVGECPVFNAAAEEVEKRKPQLKIHSIQGKYDATKMILSSYWGSCKRNTKCVGCGVIMKRGVRRLNVPVIKIERYKGMEFRCTKCGMKFIAQLLTQEQFKSLQRLLLHKDPVDETMLKRPRYIRP